MPRLLDLCSCAGLGARGYIAAGWEVTGVDKSAQPRYPGRHIVADVLTLDPEWIAENFDAIHASPPCQHDTVLKYRYTENLHPDLIDPVRELLDRTGLPYVIENVAGARGKLHNPVMLCGLMFPGLRVFRHRYFEVSGFDLAQLAHPPHRGVLCHTVDRRKAHYGRTDEWTDFVSVNGGGNSSAAAAADAMGVPGLGFTKRELNEGLPPAYTKHIGEALSLALKEKADA